MAIDIIKGRYPHVGWVDLEGRGILTEIAIMANHAQGLSFIKLNSLDTIDKQRLLRIIGNRNVHLYDLWDLMSNITLGNGANALEYFHQYVKVLTPSGEVISPTAGRMGAPDLSGIRSVTAGAVTEREAAQHHQTQQLNEAVAQPSAVATKAPAKRKRGRPVGSGKKK